MWYAVRFLGCVCVAAVCGGWYGGTFFVFAVFGVSPCCERLVNRWSEVHNLVDMKRVIEEIIDNEITGVDDTFRCCGYIWN